MGEGERGGGGLVAVVILRDGGGGEAIGIRGCFSKVGSFIEVRSGMVMARVCPFRLA